jgi:hypothetical protein
VQRWQMELTFEDARDRLGVETQRQWSDKEIQNISLWQRALKTVLRQYSEPTLIGYLAFVNLHSFLTSGAIALDNVLPENDCDFPFTNVTLSD